jgi:hypothetical protein
MRRARMILCVLLISASCAFAQQRIKITKDNSIVLYKGETHLNAGNQQRIRIKGNQHLVALSFDTTPLKGKLVTAAVLVCGRAARQIDQVTISTIQADWNEFKSNALTSGLRPIQGWAWPGALFPAITDGNSFSLCCQSRSIMKDDSYHWTVDPDLIHANIIGTAYGLCVHEVGIDSSRNSTIYSKEQRGREPYLLVTTKDVEGAVDPVSALKVLDSGDPDGMRLHLRAPRRGFAYEVTVEGKPMPRWNIPFVRPGEEQIIPIRDIDLKPGASVKIVVTVLDRIGARSKEASITARVPVAKDPAFPRVAMTAAKTPMVGGLDVIPQLDKYDVAGRAVGQLPGNHRVSNEVFDGRTMHLAAARGEVVGFQALIKGKGDVTVTCDVPGMRVDRFRAIYVPSKAGRIPDPLMTFEKLTLSPDEATPVFVDIYVPFDFEGRDAKGTLRISDGRKLPIELRIRNFSIPKRASFFCEMNSYGMTNRVSEFYALQRLAYDHRTHVNLVPYGHSSTAPGGRQSRLEMLKDNGTRMDDKRYNAINPGAKQAWWDDFVEVFGPYLSGKCFKDGHRGAVPAPGFYLTFHESWPLRVRQYFNGNPDAYEAFKAKPVYAETFVNAVKDFIGLAERQGWKQTGFQVYLNNKGSLKDANKAPWILDEPAAYWDYRALSFYADLLKQGKGEKCPIDMAFRIDVSRPQFARQQLDGKADLWVVSSSAFKDYSRLIADRREREGARVWVYGSSNDVEDSNRMIQAWALESYRGGAEGIVPWQTIDRDASSLREADQLGIFIMVPQEGGPATLHHSMRLKAYRRAQQDIEYLNLLKRKMKWTDSQLRAFIDHYVALGGEVDQASSEDAGTARFARLAPDGFRQLREAAAALLEKP